MSYPTFKARLVMGSLFDIRTKDHEGNDEPNENKHNWFVGFAVPKGPEWDAIYNHMYQTAAADPACTEALCSQGGFNWKIDDCDAPENPENKGKASFPAGHMLIKFSRYKAMGPIPTFDGSYNPILNKTAVKRGDYFIINASTKFNGAKTVKTNAGMYQNINGVMFAEAGESIGEDAFDAKSAFAGFQGGTVSNGATPQVNTPVPAPTAMTPPAPKPEVKPAHDLVKPGAPIAPPTPPMPEPPVAEASYLYEGAVYTKSQLEGFGFKEEHFATMTKA
jgi:hypothetical protein